MQFMPEISGVHLANHNSVLIYTKYWHISSVEFIWTASQSGKFVLCDRDLGRAVLMLPIYFIANFPNLGRAIRKLSSQDCIMDG